ncbi:flagellar basal body protein [uncultured Piscinibacter sp.]|uniref:flagellar basal body protein n=1 Tax=uncultured Piscinibacter sp. TaxID=1131835 RepID=UPI00260699BB|nr:flagellar basal body protein [uncultured Piscinibacter sp.]
MSPISSTALSGLNAASLHLQSAAHNIANAQTPGFHRQQVLQRAEPAGGVHTSLMRAAAPGDALAEDIVDRMVSSVVYRANLQTLRVERDMTGSLLDVLV